MADIIATEVNALVVSGSSASYTSNLCCTKSRAIALGCAVNGSYSDNLLVCKKDLRANEGNIHQQIARAAGISNWIDYSTLSSLRGILTSIYNNSSALSLFKTLPHSSTNSGWIYGIDSKYINTSGIMAITKLWVCMANTYYWDATMRLTTSTGLGNTNWSGYLTGSTDSTPDREKTIFSGQYYLSTYADVVAGGYAYGNTGSAGWVLSYDLYT